MNSIKVDVDKKDYLSCSNSCFICLRLVTRSNQGRLNSLNFFSIFLEITEIREALVCEKCEAKLAKFRKLCKSWVKVSFEMDDMLEIIQHAIFNSKVDFQSTSPGFCSMRESVMKKCEEQMNHPKAKIILQRLDTSKFVETKIRSRSPCLIGLPDYSNNCSRDNENGTSSPESHQMLSCEGENPAYPMISESKNVKLEANLDNAAATFTSTLISRGGYAKKKVEKTNNKTAVKSHVCQICHRDFNNRGTLHKHKHTHCTIPIQCKQCGNWMKNNRTLGRHIKENCKRVMHKQFICLHCFKLFKNRRKLVKHNCKKRNGNPIKRKKVSKSKQLSNVLPQESSG